MPPTGGPEGTLAGVARWVGETETSFRESVPRRGTIVGGIGHNLPQEAPEASAEAVLQGGGRGT